MFEGMGKACGVELIGRVRLPASTPLRAAAPGRAGGMPRSSSVWRHGASSA